MVRKLLRIINTVSFLLALLFLFYSCVRKEKGKTTADNWFSIVQRQWESNHNALFLYKYKGRIDTVFKKHINWKKELQPIEALQVDIFQFEQKWVDDNWIFYDLKKQGLQHNIELSRSVEGDLIKLKSYKICESRLSKKQETFELDSGEGFIYVMRESALFGSTDSLRIEMKFVE